MLSYVSEDQQLNMLREMEHEQLPFVAADPKLSTDKWSVTFINGARQLLGPLTNIVGIGPAHCEEILKARVSGMRLSSVAAKALNRCQFKIPNTSPIANRIAEILPDPTARNIISPPTPIKDIQITGAQYQVVTFAVVDKLKIEDENAPEKLAKRNGRRFDPPGTALRMWINDDEDKIRCKVPNWRFTEVAQPMLDRGRAGTAIYAIKGNVPRDFRMIDIIDVKYLGDMEQDDDTQTERSALSQDNTSTS
jgi:hypothetical protein